MKLTIASSDAWGGNYEILICDLTNTVYTVIYTFVNIINYEV